VPMSIVTRPRAFAGSAPERRLILPARDAGGPNDPRGPDRRRGLLRRRLAAAGGLLLVVLIGVAGVLLLSGSGEVPPATGAAQVVPADVLAYVHLSTDSGRPAVQRAQALARRFPDYPLAYAAAINRVTAIVGGGSSTVDSTTGIRPWLGREAAFAVLDTATGSAPSLIVLDVANRARALLARLGTALAAQGVSVHKITSIFDGETAVAISPGPAPSLLIVARTSNEAATRSRLAQLEAPLTALFPAPVSGPGQIPGLADQQVGG
jgi:Protein of unknown function (DUF3352)